jgi:hypothetical protein
MDATRARVSSLFEWLVALACILAVVAIGSVMTHQQRDSDRTCDRA